MTTPSLTFKKASKSMAKAKIALTGPSGAGKTLSALLLAKGLTSGGRVAVIDTENNSASLYEDRFDGWEYFVLPMNPPYTVQKYIMGIDLAIKEGFDCLIIDSLTHVWAAEGGLLQQKEALDSRGGNSYTNWGSITKLYEELKGKLLHSKIHMICTMRSKQEYILEQNEKGKQAPKKVGLAPIMRDGMEYEFTVVFDIGMDHQYMATKDRTSLFNGVVATVTEETGTQIKEWLKTEPPPVASPVPAPAAPAIETPEPQEFPPDDVPQISDNETEATAAGDDLWNYVIPIKVDVEGVNGLPLSKIPEKSILAAVADLEKQMKATPRPKKLGNYLEVITKLRNFLKSVKP